MRERLCGKGRNLTRVKGSTNKAQSIKNLKILPLGLAKECITGKCVKPVGGDEKEAGRENGIGKGVVNGI